jgi:GNAT superfamily N-acetyltransferase
MAESEPRAATTEDVAEMARVLGDAFTDDPIFVWLFPDAERRPRQCQLLFEMTVRHRYQPTGACQVLPDAVAAWEPPTHPEGGEAPPDQGEAVPTEAAEEGADALGPELAEAGERLGVLGALMAAHHPTEPCWYLAAIGVRPSAQGRGLGGVLLSARTAELDAVAAPAFLEATTPRSRALYERHGFEVVEELVVPDGPSMWAMWREPR